MEISETNYTDFLENLDLHFKKSLGCYPSSLSKGQDTLYHSKKLKDREIGEFFSLLEEVFPHFNNEYLVRYDPKRQLCLARNQSYYEQRIAKNLQYC